MSDGDRPLGVYPGGLISGMNFVIVAEWLIFGWAYIRWAYFRYFTIQIRRFNFEYNLGNHFEFLIFFLKAYEVRLYHEKNVQ